MALEMIGYLGYLVPFGVDLYLAYVCITYAWVAAFPPRRKRPT